LLTFSFCIRFTGFGRYFPGSYDSFLNGTNCDGIVKHIKSECRACPAKVRETVIELERHDKENPARPRYGSRKRFFTFVWTKLRQISLPADAADAPSDEIGFQAANENKGKDDDMQMENIVKDSEIVSIKDRHLVSDTTLVAMAQMKICHVTEEDKIGRCKDHKIGFKGLCCKHCGGKAGMFFVDCSLRTCYLCSCSSVLFSFLPSFTRQTGLRSLLSELATQSRTGRLLPADY
jgi:hypothetical protein